MGFTLPAISAQIDKERDGRRACTFRCASRLCAVVLAKVLSSADSLAENIRFGCRWRRWNVSFHWLGTSATARYTETFSYQRLFVDFKYSR